MMSMFRRKNIVRFDTRGGHCEGFTLAELIVATILLTIVMTAVYMAFGNAIRQWRTGEGDSDGFLEARTALSTMNHELECIIGGSEHLFDGKDDEFEFYAVTPPMNVEKGEGAMVLQIRYKFNKPGHRLERREAIVEGPLPVRPPGKEEVDHKKIKTAHKKEFVLASNIRDFNVEYIYLPKPKEDRKPEEPPVYVEPIYLERNKEGWGLPQGIKVEVTVQDPHETDKRTVFTDQITFRIPQPPYDEEKMGKK